MDLLKFLLKFLNFTLEPSIIMPLAEAISAYGESACADPHRLVTFRSIVSGDSLGYMVALDAPDVMCLVDRPRGDMPHLNSRNFV